MDDIDKRILNSLQTGLELCPEPYAALGEKLGIDEDEVLQRVEQLKDSGMIRRLGVSFDSRKLGYLTTLVAAEVEPEEVEVVADFINGFAEVTHNYLRADSLNVWFTVIARNAERLDEILDQIRARDGVHDLINLPADHIFKTRVRFQLETSDAD